MKHLVISNPLGCPFRANEICTIADTDMYDLAPDCPAIKFPYWCPLDEYAVGGIIANERVQQQTNQMEP